MSALLPLETARTASAVLLLREDGAALFQLRDAKPGLRDEGCWGLPAGHSQPGESAEACARREMREETGYVCGELAWLASFHLAPERGCPPVTVTVFWGRYDQTKPLRCFEGQEVRFLERARAASYPIVDYLLGIWDIALRALRAEFVQRER